MPVNLSIKDVPDDLVEALRARAARHGRSLEDELLEVCKATVRAEEPSTRVGQRGNGAHLAGGLICIEEAAARAKWLFPQGTESSVDYLRNLRDNR